MNSTKILRFVQFVLDEINCLTSKFHVKCSGRSQQVTQIIRKVHRLLSPPLRAVHMTSRQCRTSLSFCHECKQTSLTISKLMSHEEVCLLVGHGHVSIAEANQRLIAICLQLNEKKIT